MMIYVSWSFNWNDGWWKAISEPTIPIQLTVSSSIFGTQAIYSISWSLFAILWRSLTNILKCNRIVFWWVSTFQPYKSSAKLLPSIKNVMCAKLMHFFSDLVAIEIIFILKSFICSYFRDLHIFRRYPETTKRTSTNSQRKSIDWRWGAMATTNIDSPQSFKSTGKSTKNT